MLFNSIPFILFFPVVVLLYYLIPHRYRWIWLLAASYYFYMSWNPSYALLMLTSTAITYASGLLIDSADKIANEKARRSRKKLWVALSFISNLSILFFFKYFDFALQNANYLLGVFGGPVIQPKFDVLLPVGISFFTFQALSYTVDVYRNDIYAEKNFGKYALFVSFFPQLVAGPIERSKNLLIQINEVHHFNYEKVRDGLLLMAWGYFQKMVIADNVAIIVNTVYGNYTAYSGAQIVFATILFAIQIYCDFAGYSTIALGAAQVMGFRLMQNFNRPYFAISIQDFWHRWHISLSTWFKDYLYIPLGGSRCSTAKKYRNIMITFLASGLWHGASWNYVVWGGLHGVYQVVGDATKQSKKKLTQRLKINTGSFSHKIGKVLITFTLVVIAWVFFRASSATEALRIFAHTIHNFNLWFPFDGSLFALGMPLEKMMAVLASIVVLIAVDYRGESLHISGAIARQNFFFRWLCYFTVVFVILIFGNFGSNQFIYFQF